MVKMAIFMLCMIYHHLKSSFKKKKKHIPLYTVYHGELNWLLSFQI